MRCFVQKICRNLAKRPIERAMLGVSLSFAHTINLAKGLLIVTEAAPPAAPPRHYKLRYDGTVYIVVQKLPNK